MFTFSNFKNVLSGLQVSAKMNQQNNETAFLNEDNTLFNNLTVEEQTQNKPKNRLQTRHRKFACLSLRNVSDKSSSGVSSDENLNIEAEIEEACNSFKRPNLCAPKEVTEKKQKLDNYKQESEDWLDTQSTDLFNCPDLTQKLINNSTNNSEISGVGTLQDTLDFLELNTQATKLIDEHHSTKEINTQLLSNIEKEKSKSNSKDFDAFKHILKSDDKTAKKKLFEEEAGPSNISQLFPESQLDINMDTQNDPSFKIPHLLSTYEKVKSLKKELEKRDLLDKTGIFNDDSVTNEYRIEVDSLFNHIEESICEMGNNSKFLSDEVLDVIFDNNAETDHPEKKNNTVGNIDWSEEFNVSLGTTIKNALLNNAGNSVTQQLQCSNLNLSLTEEKPHFQNLGPFFGLPVKVQDLIKQYKGIDDLYDWQKECLNLPSIENRKNLIYALPTSGGKTLVAEILILKEILCYKKNVIFILPFVAIVQEKVWSLSPFAVALDFLVEEYASSKGTYPPRKRRRKKSVYIATIEKALGLINSLCETGRLGEIGLVVVDELHLVGEEGRGATLEAVLTKLMFIKNNIHIVGMSATIGNLEEICTFLKADVYTKNFRPVELTEYVKCGSTIARVNWKAKDSSELLVDVKKVDFKYSDSLLKIDPDMLGGLVSDIVPKSSCLIFCASKKNCENVAYLLCKTANPIIKEHMKEQKQQILNGLKDESGELCRILKISINFGIAYHHSGLTSDERRIIEEGFRAGVICVICCTSTLAAGVNLPARRVILRSPYVGRDFITLSRYKQMVGRAGRAGLGEAGDSILLTTVQDLDKVKELLMSPMSEALSGMSLDHAKGYRQVLLSCISLGIANTRSQLFEFGKHTLMSVQSERLEVSVKALTDEAIKKLFKLGAIQEFSSLKKHAERALLDITVKLDESQTQCSSAVTPNKEKRTIILKNSTKFVVSKMGSAAIKGGLELSRAHMLYDDLFQAQNSLVLLDSLHLLYLVTPYDTSEQIRPNMQIYYHMLTNLDQKQTQTAKILGLNESVAVKMLSGLPIKNVPERVINRFYVTLMLYDLWNELPVFEVSEKYQISRGIVQNLMVSAATFASNVVQFCEELDEFWAFSHLLKGMSQRLSHCCVKELMPLMELPAVKQGRAKQLFNAGYKNLQSIAKANANDLVESIEFMSNTVASQLISAAKMLLLEKVENLREEAEDVLDGVEYIK